MHSRVAQGLRSLAVWIMLLGGAAGLHAQLAFEVKDINTTRPRSVDLPLMLDFASLGTTALFTLDDGGTGVELWKLDGVTGSVELVKDICPGSCSSVPLHLTTAGGLVFFQASDGVHGPELWKSDGTASGTVMVRDIYPGGGAVLFHRLVDVGGTLYFSANDGVHGAELWTSDGTPAGTRMVADLNPGPGPSGPYIQAVSQGRFLFAATDGPHGQEPWISDGTAAGTYRIRDIYPGQTSSIANPFIADGDETALGLPDGTFIFSAEDGIHGEELWRTDGTEAGTVLIKDIAPGIPRSRPSSFALLGGKTYFRASTPETGSELWATDGTEAGTALVKDINPGAFGSQPGRLTVVNGQLFFRGVFRSLWTSDGTSEGTRFLSNRHLLAVGSAGSSVLVIAGDSFPPADLHLLKTDGTLAGTAEIKNLGPQDIHCPLNHADPKEVNGVLFFYGCRQGVGQEVWKSDGTSAGTALVWGPSKTPSFPFPRWGTDAFLLPFGGGLFFTADDGVAGAQLWHTDGSPGATHSVPGAPAGSDIWPELRINNPVQIGDKLIYNSPSGLFAADGEGTGTEPLGATFDASRFRLLRVGDLAFFNSSTPETGVELWKTDGTAAGTGLVRDFYPGGSSSTPTFLGHLGSQLLLQVSGDELWKTDGSGPGTVLLKDFWPGVFSVIQYPVVLGDTLFVIAIDDSELFSLWKTDGTEAGTVRVKVFAQGPSVFGAGIAGVVAVGNQIFLKLDDGTHGEELWVSDGTEAGTRLVKDIRPGTGGSGINWRVLPGESRLFFTADDGVHGQEPWVSDGTTDGTLLLRDVRPGAESAAVEWLPSPDQTSHYFTADDGTHGRELWMSDGTVAGTHLVKDIWPGAEPAGVGRLTVTVQSRLFFTADDGLHGEELWVSDGTEAGTRLVKDIWPGPESSFLSSPVSMGRTLAFTASDGVHGAEPWVTSGTEMGTFMLQDIASGAQSSGPTLYTSAPPYVYFVADDGISGTELWAARKAALEPTFDDVHSTYWAWAYVEALAAAGITTGCAPGLYCPVRPVTRAEMAAFLVRAVHGSGFTPPPPTGTIFTDVPASYWAASWIEQLAADGITTGCAPSQFCPESHTSRDQMAVFLLRAIHGSGYTPPPATGTRFTDVPAGYWAAAWIEQLAAEGITTGCAPNLYCPGDPVSRDQMAVFLTRAFNLPLP